MLRTQVLLTPEQKTQVDHYAEKQQTSVSAVVRAALDDYLKKIHAPKETATVLLKRASRAPLGAPEDLSTNDELLYKL